MKNVHLLRCAASLVNRRTSVYASFLGFCVPCIWAFLNSLPKIEFFNNLLMLAKPPLPFDFSYSFAYNASQLTGRIGEDAGPPPAPPPAETKSYKNSFPFKGRATHKIPSSFKGREKLVPLW
ncbi:MAG: hypothetical protein CSYNP_03176 [Syntrophus sp. SKADARSKE-3]|nr:hypothetical protein [Syntrophus sp. SKADARSKE-3]